MTSARALLFPAELQAPGTASAPYEPLLRVAELPPGSMRRVTRGDLDVLLVHSDDGIAATEDRCPHMSAPLSAGRLDGCVVQCPLHRGSFDLRSGDVVVFPTTGGLTATGEELPPWMPEGAEAKPPPPDTKARARALTRVRRLRYFPVRVREDFIEVALPR
jgi:nitrite reductase/ring-hydroxylating ferredoxin subunit